MNRNLRWDLEKCSDSQSRSSRLCGLSDTDTATSPPGSHHAGQRDTGSFSTGLTDLSLQLLGVAGLGEALGGD